MASTRKIAQQAGVSAGTVSRVFNKKSGVSDDTRRRVMEVAQELNYAPQRRLPLPLVNITHIGLLVRPLGERVTASPFYADVYQGVEQICSERRINLAFGSLDIVDGQVRTLPTLVGDERIGGLVCIGALPFAVIKRLGEGSQLPLVLVDNWFADCPWDSVMLDNAAGLTQATEYLIGLGHETIVFVCGPDHPSIVERRAGYEATMWRHHLTPHIMRMPELRVEDGETAAGEIASLLPTTTAVICSNDLQAIGMIRRLGQLGYRIPEDISVVGFDDVTMASLVHPALTTVSVDRMALGRLAVELLLSRINAPQRPSVRSTLGVKLVTRASVVAPRRQLLTMTLVAA